ncbi:MAG TPA: hypothetical protein VFY14_17440 [Streptomyces sp.]|nr:hypothetical protein [Streptomyces sp.]
MRFVFSYTQPMNYAELRDAAGRLVGLAVPGETVREFDAAPDHMWTEVTADGDGGGIESAADPADVPGDTGTEEDAEPEDETPGEDATPETTPGA